MRATLKIIGRKKGMTHLFDEDGSLVVCTVVQAEPNVIAQIKSKAKDGYGAVQLAAEKLSPSKVKNIGNPLRGHFSKLGVEPRRHLLESRVDNPEEYQVGQEFGVGYFNECLYVDVAGTSKGKGFQGAMKRWNFRGGRASHGNSLSHRSLGSTGMRSTPGRTLPGKKMPGRMGGVRVTTQNVRVVKIDEERQIILLKGPVPGEQGGLVYISKAEKKR